MPTITLSHSMMSRIQKLNGTTHEKNSLADLLPRMGCPVELNDDENIEIEVFPDRPDLLSHETMARAVRSFQSCLLYTSPSPRDGLLSRMPSSA